MGRGGAGAGPVPRRQLGVTGDPGQDGGLDPGGLAAAPGPGQRELVGPPAADHLEAGPAEGTGDRGADDLRVGVRPGGADLAAQFDRGVCEVRQPAVLCRGQRPGTEAGQGHGDHRRGQDGKQQAGWQQPGPAQPAQHERRPGPPGPFALLRLGRRAVRALAQAPAHAADATHRPPRHQRGAAMVTRLARNRCRRGVAAGSPCGLRRRPGTTAIKGRQSSTVCANGDGVLIRPSPGTSHQRPMASAFASDGAGERLLADEGPTSPAPGIPAIPGIPGIQPCWPSRGDADD